jgi:hypothetical protein
MRSQSPADPVPRTTLRASEQDSEAERWDRLARQPHGRRRRPRAQSRDLIQERRANTVERRASGDERGQLRGDDSDLLSLPPRASRRTGTECFRSAGYLGQSGVPATRSLLVHLSSLGRRVRRCSSSRRSGSATVSSLTRNELAERRETYGRCGRRRGRSRTPPLLFRQAAGAGSWLPGWSLTFIPLGRAEAISPACRRRSVDLAPGLFRPAPSVSVAKRRDLAVITGRLAEDSGGGRGEPGRTVSGFPRSPRSGPALRSRL